MTDFTPFARPSGLSMDPTGQFGVANYGDDSKLTVMFYMKSVLDAEMSRETNTPFYKNVIYVTIHPPGERLNIVDRPVREEDKRRWPVQWNQYCLNKTQVPEGTPVDVLFPNHPAVPSTLKGMGIYTIQQLAGLGGNAIDNIGMGGQDYVNKAQRFLKEAGDSAAYNKLTEELSKEREERKSLDRQLKLQAQTIKQLQQQIASLGPIDRSQRNLGHVKGVDVQTERINANHVTSEIKAKKHTPSLEEIEGLDDI